MLFRMMIVSVVVLVCGTAAYAATPPDAFLNTAMFCALNGRVGDGGQAKVGEFVSAGLKPGSWSKANDNQWIYKVKSKDPVTNKKTEVIFSFVKGKLNGVDEIGVYLERVVGNNVEEHPKNVYSFCRNTYYSLPSLKNK
jgi:hypothetical protein